MKKGALAAVAALTVVAVVTLGVRAGGHRSSGGAVVLGRGPRANHDGGLLRYVPRDCPGYRAYVDIGALVATLHLKDALTSERLPAPWKSIFRTFEDAHVRPGDEIQELAVCAREAPKDEDDPASVYVAIGGRLGGREALHKYRTIIEGLTHAKDAEVLEKESSGVPYLVSSYNPGRKWIAMPAGDVLVFCTDAVSQVGTLSEPHDVDRAAWQLGDGILASFASGAGQDEEGTRTGAYSSFSGMLFLEKLVGAEDRSLLVLDVKGTPQLSASVTEAKLASIRASLADAFAGSAFAELADPVRRMTLEARGPALHLRLEVPTKKLLDAEGVASANRHAVPELWARIRRVAATGP